MSTVAEKIEVRAPIGTVFDCWCCFESFPMFMDGVDAVTWIDSDRTRWVVSIVGVRRSFEATLIGRIPNGYLEWETTDGEVQHHGTVRFEAVSDEATMVEVRLEWEPFGVLEHTGRRLGLDRRRVRGDLRRFQELVETEPRRAAAIAGAAAAR
jgi:uncharacterized membrane protein